MYTIKIFLDFLILKYWFEQIKMQKEQNNPRLSKSY